MPRVKLLQSKSEAKLCRVKFLPRESARKEWKAEKIFKKLLTNSHGCGTIFFVNARTERDAQEYSQRAALGVRR